MTTLNRIIRRLWRAVEIRLYSEYSVANFYRKRTEVTIGNGCRIMDRRLGLFGSESYLVEIGDKVTIAEGVRFITHDGGVGVLRRKHPGVNVFGKIQIQDNCFIGVNCIIMPGVCIGRDSVIGAGAVVTRNVERGTVVAGVPAKKICSIEDYEDKVLKHCVYLETQSPLDKKKIVQEFFRTSSAK